MTNIDWSAFDKLPESTAYCKCGREYRTHVKAIRDANGITIATRHPCPRCGRADHHIKRVQSDPEEMTIKRHPIY